MSINEAPRYKVHRVNLSSARGAGSAFRIDLSAEDTLWIRYLPADVTLHIGSTGKDGIPIEAGEQGKVFTCRRPLVSLFITHDAFSDEAVFVVGDVSFELANSGSEMLSSIYLAEPNQASDGQSPPLLTDDIGRLFVRLADRLQADLDSISVRGLPPKSDFIAEASTGATHTAQVLSEGRPFVTVIGNAGIAIPWSLEVSIDGVTWKVLEAVSAADFEFNGTIGAAHVRLVADAAGGPTSVNAILTAQAG